MSNTHLRALEKKLINAKKRDTPIHQKLASRRVFESSSNAMPLKAK